VYDLWVMTEGHNVGSQSRGLVFMTCEQRPVGLEVW